MIGSVAFWKSEKNQDWSYFESIYFSYTSLLTIGYGDFQPESNSGKSFFVFWSLLAVPTLTILISNMGDTVIKLIKEVTIWLGEITVLPSESGSVQQSLKLGVMKLTGGQINVKAVQESDDNIEEAPPGGIHTPHRQKPNRHPLDKQDVEAAQKIASDFEKAEKLDEAEARRHGDRLAEDIHHYRHMLIEEIRKVYADVNEPEPKKYSYEEWSYFLSLLGEDERDPKYHRKAHLKPEHTDLKKSTDDATAVTAEEQEVGDNNEEGQKHAATEGVDNDRTEQKVKQWSWIGNRSPLMGDKEEAEWVLEKLFQRLEDELQRERKLAKKMRAKKEKEGDKKEGESGWPIQPVEDKPLDEEEDEEEEEDDQSGESSKTLEGQTSGEDKHSRPGSRENDQASRCDLIEQGKDVRPPQIKENY